MNNSDSKSPLGMAELSFLTADLAHQVRNSIDSASAERGYGSNIKNYRTPLAQSITQPNGPGTQLLIAIHPTSPLAKQLLTEMNWRYLCVEDVKIANVEWATAHASREIALVEYLWSLPWVGKVAEVRDGDRGPEVWSPNAVIDLDFVVIDPGSNTHRVRFTDTNIATVCRQLGIAFYQKSKKKQGPVSDLDVAADALSRISPAERVRVEQLLDDLDASKPLDWTDLKK